MLTNIITERIKNITYRTPTTAVDNLSLDSIVSRLVRPNTDHIRCVDALNKLKSEIKCKQTNRIQRSFSHTEKRLCMGEPLYSLNALIVVL